MVLATLGSCMLILGRSPDEHAQDDLASGPTASNTDQLRAAAPSNATAGTDDATGNSGAPGNTGPGGNTAASGTSASNGNSLAAESTSTSMSQAVARIDDMDSAGSASAEYGVAVLDRTTGAVNLGQEGSTPFYSASVVKLFTIVDVLHRSEAGEITLTSAQRDDIQRALEASDDKAMDALWSAFGGPATVTQMVSLAGLHDTSPPTSAGEWGETRLSARDVVLVYQYIFTSLNQADRTTILNDLSNAQASGADGFDQSFGLLQSPRPTGAAAKQGWMIDGSHMYLHTTGMVGSDDQYVIAVLSKQLASAGYAAGRQNVDTAVNHLTSALGVAG